MMLQDESYRDSEEMDVIFDEAMAYEPPKVAMQYDDGRCRQLVSLCRELQRCTKSRPFALGHRSAAILVGVSHSCARRWLRLFMRDGILREAEKACRVNGRFCGTRYFYVADDLFDLADRNATR